MSLFSVLKRNARLALRNLWGSAIGVMLVYMGASMVLAILRMVATEVVGNPLSLDPGFVMRYGVDEQFFRSLATTSLVQTAVLIAFALLYVLLLAPLSLGTIHFHNRLVYGEAPGVAEMFRFFENFTAYRRAIWYDINLSVRSLLWALLFYSVPGGVFGVSLFSLLQAEENAQRSAVAMSSMGILLGAFLLVLATVFYAATLNRYVLAAYLLCMDERVTVQQAIKQSVRMTKGYRFSFLLFELSFFGWLLLSVFFFPVFFTGPYLRTSIAMYARYIIEKNVSAPAEATKEFVMEEGGEAPADLSEAPPLEEPVEAAPPTQEEHPFDRFRRPTDSPTDPSEPPPAP